MPAQAVRILAFIFDDPGDPLAARFAEWIAASPRFRAFAATYQDKIRKKLRGIRDAEGYRDLLAEIEAAYLLLEERRFTLEYERGGVGKQRGPDFTVTFKTHTLFNVEVKRLRASMVEQRAEEASPLNKIVNAVCDKLPQLPPSAVNILLLAADGEAFTQHEVAAAIKLLKDRAERKDDLFFVRRGLDGAGDFLKHYRRLSGILFRGAGQPSLWTNPEAKHPLPAPVGLILAPLGSDGRRA